MKLFDYIQGNRTGKEANRLEKESLGDTFLHEAIEGFDAVEGKHAEAITRMQNKITAKTKTNHKKLYFSLSIAATIAVLITMGTIFFNYDDHNLPIAQSIPQQKTEEPAIETQDSNALKIDTKETPETENKTTLGPSKVVEQPVLEKPKELLAKAEVATITESNYKAATPPPAIAAK